MDVTMEGELKGGRRTGQTELRGTDEGEGVLMKHLIKARTDITFSLHVRSLIYLWPEEKYLVTRSFLGNAQYLSVSIFFSLSSHLFSPLFFCQAQTETLGVHNWKAATTTGSHEAVRCGKGVQRGAQIAALLKEAPRGVQTESAMRATGEESRPETLPTTGEEATESGIAETEIEVGQGFAHISKKKWQLIKNM